MRRTFFIFISLFFTVLSLRAQTTASIIPAPMQLQMDAGYFLLNKQVSLELPVGSNALKPAVNFFINAVHEVSGLQLPINKAAVRKIELVMDKQLSLKEEGYELTVAPSRILIRARSNAGMLYAFQSLLQTLPQTRTNAVLQVPCMRVTDEPRFAWRGMHLDVSRHFFSPAVIKNYIDLMAMYKMNTFHWHLVDDQGWRIEIKKYPKLTGTGAWRVDHTNLLWGSRPQAKSGEEPSYGGYYTQEQIKEIVAYAAQRNITIVPEIEMPGHVASAIAAYPELSCTGNPQLPLTGGNYANMSSNYCAGKDAVFNFLQDVLTEVIALFPSNYIHIGGDEVDKGPWKKCTLCQERIKKEGLKNEEELQSYFIKRMEKFIISKKRKMIGWDEILEGGLAPEAAVMSWRGEAGGIEAAKMNHYVVMTPGNPCYFDHYQAGPEGEPTAIGGFNTLKKVYDYEPIPKELNGDNQKFVLGAQGNVWTEYISTAEHLEYMVLPRMLALAETVWSPAANKNWDDFNRRLAYHFRAFDQKGLHYSPGNYTVEIRPESKDGRLSVSLFTEIPTAKIYYTTDGTIPNASAILYERPLTVSSSIILKTVTVQNGKVMNLRPAEQSFTAHKAFGSNVAYEKTPSKYYPANGPNSLTDGIRGKAAAGKFWHGFSGNDLVATIDMSEVKEITKISLGCFQNYGDWIFFPSSVSFEISEDGKQFVFAGTVKTDITPETRGAQMKDFIVKFPSAKARYVRVTGKVIEACPPGHPGAGKPGWLFADEIVVE
ncbi:MAG: glycoside hydrolase family 20 protein [Bacteroidota bacterium]